MAGKYPTAAFPLDGHPQPGGQIVARLGAVPEDELFSPELVYLAAVPPTGALVVTSKGRYTVASVEWHLEAIEDQDTISVLVPHVRLAKLAGGH